MDDKKELKVIKCPTKFAEGYVKVINIPDDVFGGRVKKNEKFLFGRLKDRFDD